MDISSIKNQMKALQNINLATLGGKDGKVTEGKLQQAGAMDASIFTKGNKEVSVADAENAKKSELRDLQKQLEQAQKEDAAKNQDKKGQGVEQKSLDLSA